MLLFIMYFISSFNLHTSPFLDWALTGVFYASVHYVEAALAKFGKHPPTHAHREAWITLHIKNDDVYDNHRDLKDDSRNARYRCTKISGKKINESKKKLEVIKKQLKSFLP